MVRYDATVEDLTPNGYYVTFDGWGNREEVWFLWPHFQIFQIHHHHHHHHHDYNFVHASPSDLGL